MPTLLQLLIEEQRPIPTSTQDLKTLWILRDQVKKELGSHSHRIQTIDFYDPVTYQLYQLDSRGYVSNALGTRLPASMQIEFLQNLLANLQ